MMMVALALIGMRASLSAGKRSGSEVRQVRWVGLSGIGSAKLARALLSRRKRVGKCMLVR